MYNELTNLSFTTLFYQFLPNTIHPPHNPSNPYT